MLRTTWVEEEVIFILSYDNRINQLQTPSLLGSLLKKPHCCFVLFFLSWPLPLSILHQKLYGFFPILFFFTLTPFFYFIFVIFWILALEYLSLSSWLWTQTSNIVCFFLFFLIKGFLGLGLFGKNFSFRSIFHTLYKLVCFFFFFKHYKRLLILYVLEICLCFSVIEIISDLHFVLNRVQRWWEERLKWGA